MKFLSVLACIYFCLFACAFAQKIDSSSYASIVEALQRQVEKTSSAFPLEGYDRGVQSFVEGLSSAYFGFGERRYGNRLDFHPAMDFAYFPKEKGVVMMEDGVSRKVRAPQTYLKKVYAVQEGLLYAVLLKKSGYKVILEHSLDEPYFDAKGKSYSKYYTCYRHLDSRTITFLNELAANVRGKGYSSHRDLIGKHVFKVGEQIAISGFNPSKKTPRAHLDFSLNLYGDPDKARNVRRYAMNPLLLFPVFEYDSGDEDRGQSTIPSYEFVVDSDTIVVPSVKRDGKFEIQIRCESGTAKRVNRLIRYFVLDGLDVSLENGGKQLDTYQVNRHRRLGYNTTSFNFMDRPNKLGPYFEAPLGEQKNVYKMNVIIPYRWLDKKKYDWSKPGGISVKITSIWDGVRGKHHCSLYIPLDLVNPRGSDL